MLSLEVQVNTINFTKGQYLKVVNSEITRKGCVIIYIENDIL